MLEDDNGDFQVNVRKVFSWVVTFFFLFIIIFAFFGMFFSVQAGERAVLLVVFGKWQ